MNARDREVVMRFSRFVKLFNVVMAFLFVFQQIAWSAPIIGPGPIVPISKVVNVLGYRPSAYFTGIEIADDGWMQFGWGRKDGVDGEIPLIEKRTNLKFFFSALALPDKNLWVNLDVSAREGEILGEGLKFLDIGKVFLASDVELKNDVKQAFVQTGFLDELFERAASETMAVEDWNFAPRFWIVPGKIDILENKKSMVIKSCSLEVKADMAGLDSKDPVERRFNEFALKRINELIVPRLNKIVNNDMRYALLRQAVRAIVIAMWYEKKSRESDVRFKDIINVGVLKELKSSPWSKRRFLDEYLKLYKLGTMDMGLDGWDVVGGGILADDKAVDSAMEKGEREALPEDEGITGKESQKSGGTESVDKVSADDEGVPVLKKEDTTSSKSSAKTLAISVFILASIIGIILLSPGLSQAAEDSELARFAYTVKNLIDVAVGDNSVEFVLSDNIQNKKQAVEVLRGWMSIMQRMFDMDMDMSRLNDPDFLEKYVSFSHNRLLLSKDAFGKLSLRPFDGLDLGSVLNGVKKISWGMVRDLLTLQWGDMVTEDNVLAVAINGIVGLTKPSEKELLEGVSRIFSMVKSGMVELNYDSVVLNNVSSRHLDNILEVVSKFLADNDVFKDVSQEEILAHFKQAIPKLKPGEWKNQIVLNFKGMGLTHDISKDDFAEIKKTWDSAQKAIAEIRESVEVDAVSSPSPFINSHSAPQLKPVLLKGEVQSNVPFSLVMDKMLNEVIKPGLKLSGKGNFSDFMDNTMPKLNKLLPGHPGSPFRLWAGDRIRITGDMAKVLAEYINNTYHPKENLTADKLLQLIKDSNFNISDIKNPLKGHIINTIPATQASAGHNVGIVISKEFKDLIGEKDLPRAVLNEILYAVDPKYDVLTGDISHAKHLLDMIKGQVTSGKIVIDKDMAQAIADYINSIDKTANLSPEDVAKALEGNFHIKNVTFPGFTIDIPQTVVGNAGLSNTVLDKMLQALNPKYRFGMGRMSLSKHLLDMIKGQVTSGKIVIDKDMAQAIANYINSIDKTANLSPEDVAKALEGNFDIKDVIKSMAPYDSAVTSAPLGTWENPFRAKLVDHGHMAVGKIVDPNKPSAVNPEGSQLWSWIKNHPVKSFGAAALISLVIAGRKISRWWKARREAKKAKAKKGHTEGESSVSPQGEGNGKSATETEEGLSPQGKTPSEEGSSASQGEGNGKSAAGKAGKAEVSSMSINKEAPDRLEMTVSQDGDITVSAAKVAAEEVERIASSLRKGRQDVRDILDAVDFGALDVFAFDRQDGLNLFGVANKDVNGKKVIAFDNALLTANDGRSEAQAFKALFLHETLELILQDGGRRAAVKGNNIELTLPNGKNVTIELTDASAKRIARRAEDASGVEQAHYISRAITRQLMPEADRALSLYIDLALGKDANEIVLDLARDEGWDEGALAEAERVVSGAKAEGTAESIDEVLRGSLYESFHKAVDSQDSEEVMDFIRENITEDVDSASVNAKELREDVGKIIFNLSIGNISVLDAEFLVIDSIARNNIMPSAEEADAKDKLEKLDSLYLFGTVLLGAISRGNRDKLDEGLSVNPEQDFYRIGELLAKRPNAEYNGPAIKENTPGGIMLASLTLTRVNLS